MQARLLLLPTFLLAALVHQALGQLRVIQPSHLAQQFSQGYIKGSTAAFGTPYWGEQLIGKLAYGESKSGGHCNATDYDLPPLNPSTHEDASATTEPIFARIVVVRRGVCHFVTKVRVAQDTKDAAAVIVVDDAPTSEAPTSSRDVRSVIMADDGWGRSIRIPSILISKTEGDALIKSLLSGEDVIVELIWDVPNEKIVHVDSWMSPAISASVNFLNHFAPYARIFKHRINFTPHYWIFSLPQDYNTLCLDASGDYCAMIPDWGQTNITGKDIVHESIRQTCLWHTTATVASDESSETSGSGQYSEAWWNYVEKIKARCLRPLHPPLSGASPLTEDCSFQLMSDLGVSLAAVKECVNESGTLYLALDVANHAWSPTAMMINDVRFSGPLDAFVVARAICTGYAQEPEVCTKLRSHHIQDYLFGDDTITTGWILGEGYARHRGGVAWWVYVLTILGCVVLAASSILVYRNWVVKKLRNQLRYEVFEEVKSQIGDLRVSHSHVPTLSGSELRTVESFHVEASQPSFSGDVGAQR